MFSSIIQAPGSASPSTEVLSNMVTVETLASSANKISIETKLVISSGGERAQYPVPGPAQCRVSEQPGVCLMPHQRGTTSPHVGEQGRIERDRVELNHQEKSFSFSILSQAKVKLWL